ncbi:MAG: recombinase zinc beta ribbon domain-containing protein [Clostridium sp.]
MYKYTQHSEELPFVGTECGRTMARRRSGRKEDLGEYYWCCKRYKKGRYGPVPKDACTNGIRIGDKEPEEMFIREWNRLVDNKEEVENRKPKNILEKYRKEELLRLLKEKGKIEKFDYRLMIKVLNYIES